MRVATLSRADGEWESTWDIVELWVEELVVPAISYPCSRSVQHFLEMEGGIWKEIKGVDKNGIPDTLYNEIKIRPRPLRE
jgi:hypothetical protein